MTNTAQTNEAGTGNVENTGNTANVASSARGTTPADRPAVRGTRVNFAQAAPKAFKALIGFDAAARDGLDPALVELVQIRSSQLNKCAYCLHMHTSDARKAGESEERLHMVAVWEEAAHFFTAKERAALALTEAVTLVAQGGVPDEVYDRAATHFDDAELARLLALIFTINTWNRLALSTGKVPGTDER
ncbi:carboxymuconolactone decarboxylase family protein [Streptomyces decoyicus]|uniref:Carboxymuconolactone decarboxylase family protein n=1 Tax=Streptomyces decoyicus TaxID=249567 RepID=A0ABZ1FGA6_9ACTN|nr:carboxymuconolactone decarboxylase family protein [Streptomyces decoyicus]WSB69433.1 carboxymuconolactone decarboxylase family protein [Streptomyces decoyicus]